MFLEYFYWNYAVVPKWLLALYWHLELALLQFFSVPLMLKTLVSHWHRDAIRYGGGSISHYISVFAMNQISRGLGLLVRLTILACYVITQGIFACLAIGFLVVVFIAPWVLLVGIILSAILLYSL